MKKLILASQSPRRIELLKSRGIEFDIHPASVEETLDRGLSPEENARALARQKAQAVAPSHPGCFILAADTLVALENEILGKPVDREDAVRILTGLSGREHRVITGVALIDPQGKLTDLEEISRVRIKSLNLVQISTYIETGEPMDKAGAYAIQGKGAEIVQSWSGDYDNIVGLPLNRVCDLLQQSGFSLPENMN